MNSRIGIQIQDVHKKLGPNQALAGASSTFEPGMLHGLIGPEGAGKTTLLRTVMALLHPDRGGIEYRDGDRLVTLESVRASIAYMPQQQSLYPDLSIDEHLEFFKELYQIPQDYFETKRAELLRITRLDKFHDRPAGKLSGGMYKKLGLMCALLQEPAALLLDEPTNGVDPISRREFWDLLHGLSGPLVIVATAYMDEAERCDRVHLIDSGRFIASGEPRELLEREGVPNFDALFIKKDSRREGDL